MTPTFPLIVLLFDERVFVRDDERSLQYYERNDLDEEHVAWDQTGAMYELYFDPATSRVCTRLRQGDGLGPLENVCREVLERLNRDGGGLVRSRRRSDRRLGLLEVQRLDLRVRRRMLPLLDDLAPSR